MRTLHTKLLALCMIMPLAALATTPYFNIRSQGVNSAREMVGWEELINLCDQDCRYSVFAGVVEYSQTFKPQNIARCLFGPDARCFNGSCYPSLVISGSQVTNRASTDWLADYFGLPTDFKSVISLNPRISNVVVDLEGYVGLDNLKEGMYFRFNMPLTNTRWNLRFNETVINTGTNDALFGYYSGDTISRADLLDNATEFLNGTQAPTLTGTTTTTFDKLQYAKWSPCTRTKTRFADIELVLGRNIICCDDYRLGFNIRTELPTGNKPTATYLFEPIAGNGGHATFGVGMNSFGRIWECSETGQSLSIYCDANIVHLFGARQCRTFDLCGKPNSRYMLAEKLVANTTNLAGSPAALFPGGLLSLYQFGDACTPVANLTTRTVRVTAAVQGDLSIKLAYDNGCGFIWDVGYNFWGRSCEKICPNSSTVPDISQWALKGDAFVYGFNDEGTNTIAPLAGTESRATINSGTNFPSTPPSDALRNIGIDNRATAVDNLNNTIIHIFEGSTVNTNTSLQPITLKECGIDYAGTKGISHKIFTHINYTGDQRCERWTPFIGIGGSAEFSGNNCCVRDCAASCQQGSCVQCTPHQWAVWVKGGASFN